MGSKSTEGRVLVVHNPSAGQHQPRPAALIAALASLGREVVRRSLDEVSIEEALAEPAELLVIAGGDGTVGKVMRRLAHTDQRLTILPLGTANNLATHFGFHPDPFRAITQLQDLVEQRLDLGVAHGPWGARMFVEGTGIGLLADSISTLAAWGDARAFPNPDAKIAAMRCELAGLLDSYPSTPVIAELDGSARSLRTVMVAALNVRSLGPRLVLSKDSDPGDGHLDVILVEDAHRDWLTAELLGEPTTAPAPVPIRAREVRLEWTGLANLHVDDELMRARTDEATSAPVKLTIDPAGLRLLVPRHPVRGSSPAPAP